MTGITVLRVIAVAFEKVAGNTQCELVLDNRHVQLAYIVVQAEVADLSSGFNADVLRIGIVGMDRDDASGRAAAIQRALRAAENFDSSDVIAAANAMIDVIYVNGRRLRVRSRTPANARVGLNSANHKPGGRIIGAASQRSVGRG